MHRPNISEEIQKISEVMQSKVKVPMLLAGNVCHGIGEVAVNEAIYATNMGVGATGDPEYAYRQGIICGEGCRVLGLNWTYAPVTDLNINFMSSVIGTRAYGDNADLVADMAAAYIKGVQEAGVAANFKHFPGDGVDFRDQHVTPSVNSLSCEEWDATYGKVYRKLIEAGTLTCMIGHITLPSYSMKLNSKLSYGDCLPASFSKELLTSLLREKLGFNGMIVTDAAQMAGMCASLPREVVVPLSIEAGSDMFLFYCDFDEDVAYMMKGLENGILSRKRLDEAVTRVLATKAALGLHKGLVEKLPLSQLRQEKYSVWTKEVADAGITLVKNLREDLFPITSERYPKILVYSHVSDNVDPPVMRPEMEAFRKRDKEVLFKYFVKKLEEEGFEVDIYDEKMAVEKKLNAYHSRAAIKEYDLALHFANVEKDHGRAERLLYKGHCANNAPYTDMYIPTVLISMTSPYLLVDAPRVKTVINCYTASELLVDVLIEKLTGRSEFKGKNPVDPFCGMEDTKW